MLRTTMTIYLSFLSKPSPISGPTGHVWVCSLMVARWYPEATRSQHWSRALAVRKLTKVAVESLPPGDTIWDTEVRGFGARRRRREITFVLKSRLKGQQRFLTIGRFGAPWTVDLARNEAQRVRAEMSSGRDPAQARRSAKAAATLSEFAVRCRAEHAVPRKQPRTVEEDRRMLRLHLLPALGSMRIGEITG